MENKDWVKKQFELFKKRYRDVLIITSFIETIIRKKVSENDDKEKEFKKSLKILGLKIDRLNEKKSSYEQNCQYKKDCLIEINVIRVLRNELLHDIIKKKLPQEYIDNTVKEMAKNIKVICTKSDLIRDYFKKNYKFDPATEI